MQNSCLQIAVIMAGGAGERFWPLSRRQRPKQLLHLGERDRSLLAATVARVAPEIPPERILVVTGRHLVRPIRDAGTGLPPENIIAEPCKRNTAGCLIYAAAVALARFHTQPESLVMSVLTADHQVGDGPGFLQTLRAAQAAAVREPALVTIGIRPERPETGYGYIEIPDGAAPRPGSDSDCPVFPVGRFREKPDLATAREFLAASRFLWNSGMFFWRVRTFLDELRQARPDMADSAARLVAAMAEGDRETAARCFEELPAISVDCALMEGARQVLVVPARFEWDDVGAWDALDRTYPHDGDGNVALGEPVLIDSSNCIVVNEPGAEAVAVAVVGASDLVVVVTEDGVLVVPKKRAQSVRAAVKALRDAGSEHL